MVYSWKSTGIPFQSQFGAEKLRENGNFHSLIYFFSKWSRICPSNNENFELLIKAKENFLEKLFVMLWKESFYLFSKLYFYFLTKLWQNWFDFFMCSGKECFPVHYNNSWKYPDIICSSIAHWIKTSLRRKSEHKHRYN